MPRRFTTAMAWAACVLAASLVWADDIDWASMSHTPHEEFQAVDADGNGTFSATSPVKMRGVILNRPQDMLGTLPGSDPFMGGQWQMFIQATEGGDFGGTALWMGQNVGKIMGNHPAGSYTDAQWQVEVDRVNHDPATGRAFRPGDLVEIRARGPGLFHNGKTNVNEQHSNNPAADFDVVLIQAGSGLPAPQVLQLSDLKDAADQFIFDPTRAAGDEHYQGTAIRINQVSFTSTAQWGPEGELTMQDGTGRTFPVLLGRGEGFTRYAPPSAPFDIVGILDQEDGSQADGYKGGYRLWVMDYDGSQFVSYRYAKPDFNRDGSVDDADHAHFAACVTGPAIAQADPNCLNADFTGDGDVDQEDFGVLQGCFSGPLELPGRTCD